jgi:hypothetical protein
VDLGPVKGAQSWLAHAVALATGSPAPIDHHFVPFDQREAKTAWGRKVLALRAQLLADGGGRGRQPPAARLLAKAEWGSQGMGHSGGGGARRARDVSAEELWDLAAEGGLPWNDIGR